MNGEARDRMASYIGESGAEGATAVELAEKFLHAAAATPELCAQLVRGILGGDGRVLERPDGRWTASALATERGPTREGFVVVEVAEAVAGAGRVIVEWAAVHVDEQGRIGEATDGPIRPDPWPKGLVLPPRLRGNLGSAPVLGEAVAAAAAFASRARVVSMRPGPFQSACAGDSAPTGLLKLARHLPSLGVRSAEALAAVLSVPSREPETAAERAGFTAELFSTLLVRREEFALPAADEWLDRPEPLRKEVDFSDFEFDREDMAALPDGPGVYILSDASGRPVYVGKAASLRERVSGYFRARIRPDPKTERILEAAVKLNVIRTGSELEALILERRKIRELQPPVNVQYEVHDRPSTEANPDRRLAIILPDVSAEKAAVCFVRGAEAAVLHTVRRNAKRPLRKEMKAFFFTSEAAAPPSEDAAEIARIAWSWLRLNRDKANAFDVDMAGGLDGAVRMLGLYLREEESGERVFHV